MKRRRARSMPSSIAQASSMSQIVGSTQAGNQTYTWTVSMPMQTGTFVDGSPWVVANGATLTTISPAPNTATVTDGPEADVVYDGGNSRSATGLIDGAMKNPGSNLMTQFIAPAQQQFDFRYVAAGTAGTFNLPLALSAGDRIVLSKSLSTPIFYTGKKRYAHRYQHSMACLTVLAEPPPANCYRPSVYGGTLFVPRLLESAVPMGSLPSTGLDMQGVSRTANWPAVFDNAQFDTWRHGIGGAMAMNAGPTDGCENLTCQVFNDDNGWGYGSSYFMTRALLRLRFDTSLNSAARQALVDSLIQWAVDLHGYCTAKTAANCAETFYSPPNGGYVGTLPGALLMVAELVYQAGATTAATELRNLALLDNPTFAGNGFNLTNYKASARQIQGQSRIMGTGNRASATVFNSAYTVTSSTTNTITISSSVDWKTLVPVEQTDQNRHPLHICGSIFQVTGGTASGSTWYMITGNTVYNNGLGGTWSVYPNLAAGTVTQITFAVCPDAMLNFYASPVSYKNGHSNNYLGINDIAPFEATCFGHSYCAQNAGQSMLNNIAAHGWTSLISGSPLANDAPLLRVKHQYNFKRLRGDNALDFDDTWSQNIDLDLTLQMAYREVVFDGAGKVGTPWVVPAVA